MVCGVVLVPVSLMNVEKMVCKEPFYFLNFFNQHLSHIGGVSGTVYSAYYKAKLSIYLSIYQPPILHGQWCLPPVSRFRIATPD